MKYILIWVILMFTAIVLTALFKKADLLSAWDRETSPVYLDAVLLMLGANLAIGRGVAIWHKLFP